ncbi:unnamed protein product [Ectocarpus sp. 13 AM-2016]
MRLCSNLSCADLASNVTLEISLDEHRPCRPVASCVLIQSTELFSSLIWKKVNGGRLLCLAAGHAGEDKTQPTACATRSWSGFFPRYICHLGLTRISCDLRVLLRQTCRSFSTPGYEVNIGLRHI